ncbi:hypothetical protein ACHAPJ_008381 [Fusarium lateritium]
MSTEKSPFKATAFGLWSLLFGFLWSAATYRALSHTPTAFLLIFLLIAFTLEAFLLFKTASYIPALSPWTRRFTKFFYETRDSAMVLPIMSIIWLISILFIAGMTFIDLISPGPVSNTLTFISNHFTGVVAGIIYVGSILNLIALGFWVIWAGIKAFQRVYRLKSPEEEEAMALTAKDDDEWNDFQDDREN